MQIALWALLGCVFASLATVPALALDDVRNGERLATQWCASCHVIKEDQTIASADVPPFAEIAKRHSSQLDQLSTFLLDPHPVMPNYNLSRKETLDLVAYIRSLKQP